MRSPCPVSFCISFVVVAKANYLLPRKNASSLEEPILSCVVERRPVGYHCSWMYRCDVACCAFELSFNFSIGFF